MVRHKKVACVIPARLASTRFPEKILKNLAEKPLLQWVFEAASKTTFFDSITFAVDSEKTAHLVKSFGGTSIITSEKCKSGTDRLVEIMHTGKVDADIWVNWQGDEPFITPNMIATLLQSVEQNDSDMWTLRKKIEKEEEIESSNIAKVVCDIDGFALYFSRSVIPFYRDKSDINRLYYKHIGLYAYTTKGLQKISRMSPCYLEDAEKLEQLRFLHQKLTIKVHETDQEVMGIDTPQDLEKAEEFVKKRGF